MSPKPKRGQITIPKPVRDRFKKTERKSLLSLGGIPDHGKCSRPDAQGKTKRHRLFRLLDKNRKKSLIWVSGPAGAGKTTLVSSYVEERLLSCLWYQIDTADADPATFFYYLGLAARAVAPRKSKKMPLLTPEYARGMPTFTRRFFDELFSRVRPPALAVFDNVQEAAASREFLDILCQGLAHVPVGVNVVLISRETAPQEFARTKLSGDLAEIGWEEIRLAESETRAIAKERRPKGIDLQNVHARTAGWVAGLIFMLEGVQGGVPNSFDPCNVFDYFATEVFRQTPPATRDFLMRTAYLPSMTESMANEVTGKTCAGRLLRELVRKNHFTHRHVGPTVAYSYHPLFRAFLLDRAKAELAEEELLMIIHRSAIALSRAGRAEEATALFRDKRDWEDLSGLLMEYAPVLIAQGRNQMLQNWFGSMPRDVVESDPWLLYWLGVAWLPFAPARAQADLARASRLFAAAGDIAGQFASFAGVVEAIIYGFDDFKQLDEWIARLDDLEVSCGGVPAGWVETVVTSAMFSALVMRQPSHIAFGRWCERALEIARNAGDLNIRARTLLHYLYFLELSGNFKRAEHVVAELRSLRKVQDAPPLAVLTASMAEAMAETWTGNGDACRRAVEEGLAISERTGMHMFDFMIAGQGAMVSLHDGSSVAARAFLVYMEKALSAYRPWDESLYLYLMSIEAVSDDRLDVAREYALRALGNAHRVGAYQSVIQIGLLCAQISAASGEHDKAKAFADEARLEAEKTFPGSYLEFLCRLVKAQVLLVGGGEREGLAWLEDALSIGGKAGYRDPHLWIWPRRHLIPLCMEALENGIQPEYVKTFIRRGGIVPDSDYGIEDWPYPFRIRTLGAFTVEAGGMVLSFTGKTPRKPLALLKALIALGVREVPVDRILDALWPEADGDAANRSFTAALHRLRKILGDDRLFILAAGRLSLDLGRCFVDVVALERLLALAREAGDDDRPDLLERALSLYRGDFLEGDENELWSVPCREGLRQKILSALAALGAMKEKEGKWQDAVALYEKGLELNPLVEEYYRGLMRCHLARGEQSAAAGVYVQCREALEVCLGVTPSEETESLKRMTGAS